MVSDNKRALYNSFKESGLLYKVEEYEKRYPELVEEEVKEVKKRGRPKKDGNR